MKEELKTVYRCDHCKKSRFVKRAMEQHERFCMKNPANVPMCFKGANGCKYFKNWNCSALDTMVCTERYAHINRYRFSAIEDEQPIMVMPKMCDKYEKAPTEEDYFFEKL